MITNDHQTSLKIAEDCCRLRKVAKDHQRSPKIPKDCGELPQITKDCLRLSKIAEDYRGLPKILDDCRISLKRTQDRERSRKIAKDLQRLPKIVKNHPISLKIKVAKYLWQKKFFYKKKLICLLCSKAFCPPFPKSNVQTFFGFSESLGESNGKKLSQI